MSFKDPQVDCGPTENCVPGGKQIPDETWGNTARDHGSDLMDQRQQTVLVSFKSGHYKKITGTWKGDSVWGHYIKPNGKQVHINKDEVEYIEEL